MVLKHILWIDVCEAWLEHYVYQPEFPAALSFQIPMSYLKINVHCRYIKSMYLHMVQVARKAQRKVPGLASKHISRGVIGWPGYWSIRKLIWGMVHLYQPEELLRTMEKIALGL